MYYITIFIKKIYLQSITIFLTKKILLFKYKLPLHKCCPGSKPSLEGEIAGLGVRYPVPGPVHTLSLRLF